MAEPASQGFGKTKQPDSCNSRNLAIAANCLLIGLRLPFAKESLRRRRRFGFCLFLQLLIDAPDVTKRIAELPVTGAPEHVLQGHQHFGAALSSALENAVRVVRH